MSTRLQYGFIKFSRAVLHGPFILLWSPQLCACACAQQWPKMKPHPPRSQIHISCLLQNSRVLRVLKPGVKIAGRYLFRKMSPLNPLLLLLMTVAVSVEGIEVYRCMVYSMIHPLSLIVVKGGLGTRLEFLMLLWSRQTFLKAWWGLIWGYFNGVQRSRML